MGGVGASRNEPNGSDSVSEHGRKTARLAFSRQGILRRRKSTQFRMHGENRGSSKRLFEPVLLGGFLQLFSSVQLVVERLYADTQFLGCTLFVAMSIERRVDREHFQLT